MSEDRPGAMGELSALDKYRLPHFSFEPERGAYYDGPSEIDPTRMLQGFSLDAQDTSTPFMGGELGFTGSYGMQGGNPKDWGAMLRYNRRF